MPDPGEVPSCTAPPFQEEITEENIDAALKDIRMAMLEADVNFRIAKKFIKNVKEKALGEVVKVKAKGDEKVDVIPGRSLHSICHDELESLLGPVDTTSCGATRGSARPRS